jgi:hypothetical protein
MPANGMKKSVYICTRQRARLGQHRNLKNIHGLSRGTQCSVELGTTPPV